MRGSDSSRSSTLPWENFAGEYRDGYWDTEPREQISYPPEGSDRVADAEDDSFWFAHRNEVIRTVVERARVPQGLFIDVGGGNGFVSGMLQSLGFPVALIEPSPEGCRNAVARNVRTVVRGTLQSAQLPPGSVAGAGLFDVIEHVEDDRDVLEGVRRALAPDGVVLLTVPAHQWLWSTDDDMAGHFRRYTKATLRRVLEASGFHVEFMTHFFWVLAPAIFALKAVPSRLGFGRREIQMAEHDPSPSARAVTSALLAPEIRWIRAGRSLPFGSSIIASARR